MRLLGLGACVVALVSCGGSEPDLAGESSPDPRHLVVRLADLPSRFSLVPGETIPTSLESVLADPWSKGIEAAIERERIAGFQTSVWSPERRRIECSVAVYRSTAGARRIFRLRDARIGAFLAHRHLGGRAPVSGLGSATAYRFDAGPLYGLAVNWRYGRVLSTCSMLGKQRALRHRLMEVVWAQQDRLATALG